MAAVELRHLSRTFGGLSFNSQVRAVDDLSLTVNDGELLTLVGPSGCGKSTTLRMIAGLEEPTGGNILIADKSMSGVSATKRNVAMVFQQAALYPNMTVRKNLAFGLRMQRTATSETESRVNSVAEKLGIGGLLDRYPDQLSGGEQQRVALGRAIVRHADVYLLDEPLSNLDAGLRSELRAEIASLHREMGCTMIVVTHDQSEAMTLGQRLAVMHEGKLQQVGTPQDIYREPANRFVASFIGNPSMNFVPGSLQNGEVQVVTTELHIVNPVTVGIRPEAIVIGESKVALGKATIEAIEFLGHEQIVRFRWGDSQVTGRIPSNVAMSVDDRVDIAASELHVFQFNSVPSLSPRIDSL